MPSVLYPPARPQAIAEVLDCAFRIFRATLLKCLPFSVIATIAGQLQNIYTIVSGRHLQKFGNSDPTWWALYLVGVFLSFACVNSIFIRQAALAAGETLRGTAALARGMRAAPSSIAVTILMVSIVGICAVPLLAVARTYFAYALLLVLVPACYLGVLFVCSLPALLIGHKGILGSLRHSAHLVRGNWWRTVMIYTVVLTMIIVLSVTAGLIIGVITQLAAARDLAVMTAVSTVMVVASGAVYVPFVTAMSIALYGDLEARKDGRDIERRIANEPAPES
jgi:hypothetical protein